MGNNYEIITSQKQEIEKLAGAKELLFRELHHRIRSNLQMIYSILSLQSQRLKDPEAINAIEDNIHRVWAIALVHHKLYRNNKLTQINMPGYINELITNILEISNISRKNISLQQDIQNIYLEADIAIPLGLIINELLNHVLKQNYHGISDPELIITLTEKNNEALELRVQGNGKGDLNIIDTTTPDAFGMELIFMLTKQLKGKFENANRNGTGFQLTIYNYK